jgi:hypothetical protein
MHNKWDKPTITRIGESRKRIIPAEKRTESRKEASRFGQRRGRHPLRVKEQGKVGEEGDGLFQGDEGHWDCGYEPGLFLGIEKKENRLAGLDCVGRRAGMGTISIKPRES